MDDLAKTWPPDTTPPNLLDVPTIQRMHPDPEGHIVFAAKPSKQSFRTVASIPVKGLFAMLPGMMDSLLRDSYCTVNTFGPPCMKDGKLHHRGNALVRRLCSCFADLDFYKLGMTFEQIVGALQSTVGFDWLPSPSIIARSGRGAYAFWLFDSPVKPTVEHRRMYKDAQLRLNLILQRLGADLQARDISRFLRTPGSYHTVAKKRVHYIPLLDQDKQLFTYDLPELFASLHVPTDLTPRVPVTWDEINAEILIPAEEVARARMIGSGRPFPKGSLADERIPAPTRKQQYVAAARVRDLQRIAEARGGIREGHRHLFLWRYAQALHGLGLKDAALAGLVAKVNREACIPPQQGHEIYTACQQLPILPGPDKTFRHVRSDTLALELHVTAEEGRKLALESIMPTTERERRKKQQGEVRTARKNARDVVRATRQAKLARLLNEWRRIGSQPPGARILGAEFGVSRDTIMRDMRALGFPVPKRGRPRI